METSKQQSVDPEFGSLPQIDLSKPRYDQSTFSGRASHFFEVTDPRNLFVSTEKLEKANILVKQYK